MEYNFTLKFKLAIDDADVDALVERLGDAGCEDALVGIGQAGRIALDFTREATSAEAAVVSGLRNVKEAIPDARLVEVSPDFVGLSDIAEIVGVTRQNMRKLMLAHATTFPVPIHEGSSSVWHLAALLKWLVQRGSYRIDDTLIDVAHIAMQLNLAKDASPIAPRLQRELHDLLT